MHITKFTQFSLLIFLNLSTITILGEGNKVLRFSLLNFVNMSLFHTRMSKYSPQSTLFLDILTLRSPHGLRNRDLHPHETTIQSALKLNSTSLTIPRRPTGRVR